MRAIKAVFDVNIFISYFIKDRMDELFDMVFGKDILLFRNLEMQRELEEVLNRPKFKKYLSSPILHYIDFFDKITIPYSTVPIFKDCADPKDNYLFDIACQANVNYLVSGDKKVLSTSIRNSIRLISLSNFKKEVYV